MKNEDFIKSVQRKLFCINCNIKNLEDNINSNLQEYQFLSEKGQNNGYAPLNNEGIIPDNHLPSRLIPLYVNTYNDLPDASISEHQTYFVLNSQGTKWLPGSLGGTYYAKGVYFSNGIEWIYMGEFPHQSTQLEVNAGTDNTSFVTPLTLNNTSQWNTKQDTLISGTNIKTINNSSIIGSGNLNVGEVNYGTDSNINGIVISNGSNIINYNNNYLQRLIIQNLTNSERLAINLGVIDDNYTVYDTDWKCEFSKKDSTWVQKTIPVIENLSDLSLLLNPQNNYRAFVQSEATNYLYFYNQWKPEIYTIRNIFNEIGAGYKGQTIIPIFNSQSNITLNNAQARLFAVIVEKPVTVNSVNFFQITSGVYTATDYNGIGLYSLSDNTLTKLTETPNSASFWSNSINNWHQKDFSTSVNLNAGIYYLITIYSASSVTTNPVLYGNAFGGNPLFSGDFKVVGSRNSQRTLPTTFNISDFVTTFTNMIFMCLK